VALLENDPASFEVFDRFVTLLRDRPQEMQKQHLEGGPLLLEPAIERALGVDSYAADVIRRSHATMELLSPGIFNEPKEAR
jgi:hypothetical protein